VVLEKIAQGNLSNVDPVGEGVSEYKLDWVRVTGSISGGMASAW
jgi:putative component of toxin-antitoxin plasmid stabilization module